MPRYFLTELKIEGFRGINNQSDPLVLKFKTDAAAGEERGKDWSGIHHFGFQVESLEAIAERLAQVGSQRRDDINNALGLGRTPQRNANVEVKYTAPDGVTVDVSETGWVGTPTFNPR